MMSSMDDCAERFLSFGASDSFCVGEFDFLLKRKKVMKSYRNEK